MSPSPFSRRRFLAGGVATAAGTAAVAAGCSDGGDESSEGGTSAEGLRADARYLPFRGRTRPASPTRPTSRA